MNNLNVFECEVIPIKKLYNNEFYKIYSAEPKDTKNHPFILNSYGNFIIKGKFQDLQENVVYKARLQESYDKQKRLAYEVHEIYRELPKTKEDQKEFLYSIMTEMQVNEIYKAYPDDDVIELFKNDTLDYKKIKGIGEYTYQLLRKKVIDNIEWQPLFVELGKYGIKFDTMMKLRDLFGTTQNVIEKVKENPYVLTMVSGIGFKKADKIAQSMKIAEDSPFRIQSAIRHIVAEEEQSGHTYTNLKQILTDGVELLGIAEDLIQEQIDNTDGLYIEGTKIALKKTYVAEKEVAKMLVDKLNNSFEIKFDLDTFLKEQEELMGMRLTNKQKEFFHNFLKYNVTFLIGAAGCVDKDTEYFNGREWKPISNYSNGEQVLQYKDDGTAELVHPEKFIKLPESRMTLIKTKSGGINQCLSDEHTIIYETSRGNLGKIDLIEMKDRHEKSKLGFKGKLYTTFNYNGKGISLSDDEIRVMVMVIAEGYFPPHVTKSNYCSIRVKKMIKKDRIEQLLNRAKIKYTYSYEEKSKYHVYRFYAPLKTKEFDEYWYGCSNEQLNVVTDEVLRWDARIKNDKNNRMTFFTSVKKSAEFIQFAFSATGSRANIHISDRTGEVYRNKKYIRKSIEYIVHISKSNKISLQAKSEDKKIIFEDYIPTDGYKYCFSVPSGMWVMRRENRICVTGNCGKSMLQKILINLIKELREKHHNNQGSTLTLPKSPSEESNINTDKIRPQNASEGYTYKLLAPTGRAAKVLSQYVEGESAHTIHKAIGYGRKDKDTTEKDEEAKRELNEDIIVSDESGMIDIKLEFAKLKKLTNEYSRLVFIGDSSQIPSVGAGNFLKNCVDSNVFPVTVLDQVFRQKEGGILDIATMTRKGEKFIADDFMGEKLYGKDTLLHSVDQKHMEKGVIHYYEKLLKNYAPEDIMVLTYTKKGTLGTHSLNRKIQNIVNPPSSSLKERKYGEDCTFRVGDYVMNTVNTYEIRDIEGKLLDIMNGESGKIVDIVTEKDIEDVIKNEKYDAKIGYGHLIGVYIQFDEGIVAIPFEMLGNLIHAWVLTIHKSQGGNTKAGILVVDKSHKFNLNANIIYTGVTRCKERLVILCQAESLNFALRKFENMSRRTFLEELLINESKNYNE